MARSSAASNCSSSKEQSLDLHPYRDTVTVAPTLTLARTLTLTVTLARTRTLARTHNPNPYSNPNPNPRWFVLHPDILHHLAVVAVVPGSGTVRWSVGCGAAGVVEVGVFLTSQ